MTTHTDDATDIQNLPRSRARNQDCQVFGSRRYPVTPNPDNPDCEASTKNHFTSLSLFLSEFPRKTDFRQVCQDFGFPVVVAAEASADVADNPGAFHATHRALTVTP